MTTTPKLTQAARRDLDALRRGEPVDMRYGPYRQLIDAGLISGPQNAPRLVEVTPMKAAPATREAWLLAAVDALRPMFADGARVELPATVAVSVGWPAGKSARKVIGQCWPTMSGDGVPHMYISPTLSDPVEVLAVLAHELVHAYDDCEHGHKAPFARVARAIGLTGKMTATVASEPLRETLAGVAATLGEYPHKRVTLGGDEVKKQGTRMLKVECPACGYTLRTTAKWLEVGVPTCCCGADMECAA